MKNLSPQQMQLFIIGLAALVLVNTATIVYIAANQSNAAMQNAPMPQVLSPAEVAETPAGSLERYTSPILETGRVLHVSGSAIRITGQGSSETSIKITSGTKLFRETVRKSDAEIEADQKEFMEKIKTAPGATELFIAPTMYETEEISLSDIVAGDIVSVVIIDGMTNEAAKVTILQKP